MSKTAKQTTTCSFCGKPASEAMAMVIGSSGSVICEDCIAACADAVMTEAGTSLLPNSSGRLVWSTKLPSHPLKKPGTTKPLRSKGIPTPAEIYQQLSESVIGQEDAKRVLSVAAYNHFTRNLGKHVLDSGDVTIEKSNVMMIGPTGSGKTLLAKSLASIVGVPFAIGDATALTEAGYVGADVETLLVPLLSAANGDVKLAEKGIVFIDEIDKIARTSVYGRDISGSGVQQALLKLIEGMIAKVPTKRLNLNSDQGDSIEVDTTNILFIVGGAFPGLEEIIAKRSSAPAIGFTQPTSTKSECHKDELLSQMNPDDLEKYGMLPEFIGRLPIAVTLKELTEDDLVQIQTEPKNAILKQFDARFVFEDSKLTFTEGALRAVAREALERGTGARGIRSIYERVLNDVMFTLPSVMAPTSVLVSESDILGETMPVISLVGKSSASTELLSASCG